MSLLVGSLHKNGLVERRRFRRSSTMIRKAKSALLAQKQQRKVLNRPRKTKAGQKQNGR